MRRKKGRGLMRASSDDDGDENSNEKWQKVSQKSKAIKKVSLNSAREGSQKWEKNTEIIA